MSYKDRKPDYEDDQVRFWSEPLEAKKQFEDDEDSKSTIKVKLEDGQVFLFYASWVIFADKEHTRPVFAFKPKHEEEMVLWVEIPENIQTVDEEKLMEEAKTVTLGIWTTMGYTNRDAREVLNHVMDKIPKKENKNAT
jgi:hypothetical protein